MSPDAFVQHIQQQLAQAGLLTLRRGLLDLALVLYGREVGLHLEALYQHYCQQPHLLDELAADVLRKAQQYNPDYMVTEFAALQDRIYPMLKQVTLLASVREHNLPMLSYRLLPGELMITYVIQEAQSVSYIHEDHLARWQINEATLHRAALTNLRQRTAPVPPTILGSGTRRVLLFQQHDGFDATRLLLTDVLAAWQAELPGRLVIGIPHRDMLLAFSDAEQSLVQALVQQMQLDYMQHSAGLSEQLYTLRHNQIALYAPRRT